LFGHKNRHAEPTSAKPLHEATKRGPSCLPGGRRPVLPSFFPEGRQVILPQKSRQRIPLATDVTSVLARHGNEIVAFPVGTVALPHGAVALGIVASDIAWTANPYPPLDPRHVR